MPTTTTPLLSQSEAKAKVDAILAEFIVAQTSKAQSISPDYVQLWDVIAALNNAGGKGLRPYMALLSYKIFGGSDENMTQIMAAWELLHLCLLIHDDVIDNDLVRYGVNNIAGEYEQIYGAVEATDERRKHLAASAAILAGDLALSGAHELIATSFVADADKITALRYILDATFAVAGGELLDTESVIRDFQSVDSLAVATFKTASYSFVGPLKMGADLAGASSQQLALVEQLGNDLGCAYQLIDDLLGVYGNSAITGKSTISDIREGKRTYLMQQAFMRAEDEDKQLLESFVGKPDLTDAEAGQVAGVLTRCGAQQAVRDQIDTYLDGARQAIDALSQENESVVELEQLLNLTTNRTY